jgi:DNA (cytosine-5)-methyltransferase 1
MKPRLLDLFCGAGGCTKGYQNAGFYVVGVDIVPQPNYCGDEFVQANAIDYLRSALAIGLGDLVAIHASPPCQFATAYKRTGNVKESPNWIPSVREWLYATGLPFVIENVAMARDELHEPTMLCGSMFDPPMEVERHRLFETNWDLRLPMWPCRHKLNGRDRYPGGRSKQRTGSSRGLVRATVEVGSWDIPLRVQQEAMGIDWMSLEELSQAIPPAYTEFIGAQLLAHIEMEAAA